MCGVFEVAVRTTGTVDADVAGCGDVGASVGFAHDGDHGDTRSGSDGFGLEQGGQLVLVVLRKGADYLHQFGGSWGAVLFCYFADQ